ncbi:Rho guanine nucleotide exchange factor [Stygiomarasmius scandens]|uniref:Rho guanine nucleotide exchange factor n=1 Tax=Marasmiellus scandens TaxID=2682957 RepID=A0ABR1IQC7_9AGAR
MANAEAQLTPSRPLTPSDLALSNISNQPSTTASNNSEFSSSSSDSHHNGRMGGTYILYAESAQVRAE